MRKPVKQQADGGSERRQEREREREREREEPGQPTENSVTEQSPEEIRRLLHELQVHQAELEMQNQELRETQERLHLSERRYHDLFHLAPVGYLSLDLHGRILELNQAAARLLKAKSTRTVLQTPFLLFVHPDSRESYTDHLRRVSESGSRQACELVLVSRDGSETPARLES